MVTRVASLIACMREAQKQFKELCVMCGVVTENDCSLEDCLVGLREALASHDIKLKVRYCLIHGTAEYEFLSKLPPGKFW